MKIRFTLSLWIFLFAIPASESVSYALAEKAAEAAHDITPPRCEGLPNEIGSYVRYMPYSGVSNMPGEIGMIQFGGEYRRELKLFGKLPLDVSAGFDYMNIDKTVDIPLPVAVMNLRADLETKLPLFNISGAYIGLGMRPSLAGDRYSLAADSFLLPARFFVIYKFNDEDNLIFAGGAEFFSDFDNNVQPIGAVIYKATDRLVFNLVTEESNITYKVTDRLDLFVEGGYNIFDQFRVHREDNNNVLLEYRDVCVGGGFNFRPAKNVSASLIIGGVFDRRLKYPDAGGKMDIKKSMYLEGNAQLEF